MAQHGAFLSHDHPSIATHCDMFFVRDDCKEDGVSYSAELCPIPEDISSVEILHPGFPSGNRILLLPQLDAIPGSKPGQLNFGHHYGTLMMICFIITKNSRGFLSPVKLLDSGLVPATPPPGTVQAFDSLLTEPAYYYYICKLRFNSHTCAVSLRVFR
jgi:hypothetical protein